MEKHWFYAYVTYGGYETTLHEIVKVRTTSYEKAKSFIESRYAFPVTVYLIVHTNEIRSFDLFKLGIDTK